MPLATEEYTDPECNVCGAIIHNSFEQNDDREAIQSSIYQHYNYAHSDIKNSKQLAEQQIYDQFAKTNVSDPFLEESKSDFLKDFAEQNDIPIYDASDFKASSLSDAIKIANQHGLECPRCHEKAVWSPVIPEMLCANCGYKYSIESKASEYIHLESLPDHFDIDDDREDDIMGGWASADVIVCNYCEKKFDLEDSNGERNAIRHLKTEHGITESKAKEGTYSKMREIANKEWQDMDEQQRYNILHQSRNYDTDRMAKDAVESEDLDELEDYVFNMDALIDALLPFPIEDYTDESKASLEMLKQIEKPHEVVAMRNIGVYGSDGGSDEDIDDLIATLEDGLNDVEGEDKQRMLKAIEEGEASLSDPTNEEESEFGFSISDKLQDEVDEAEHDFPNMELPWNKDPKKWFQSHPTISDETEQEPFDLKADSTAFSDLKSIRKKQRESEDIVGADDEEEQLTIDQYDDDPTDNSIPKTDKEMAEDDEPPDMATAIKRLQEESHMCNECMKSFIDGREAQALEVISDSDKQILSDWVSQNKDWTTIDDLPNDIFIPLMAPFGDDIDKRVKAQVEIIDYMESLAESQALEGSDNVPASGRVEDILLMNPNARVEGLKGIRWLLRREGYTDKQIDKAVNENPILNPHLQGESTDIEFQFSEPKDWNMEVSPNEMECPDCSFKTADLEELEDHIISHDPHYVGV